MKVTIFAFAAMIITTAFVFINSAIISDMTEELTDKLSSIPESIEYEEAYREAKESFVQMRKYMNLTISHEALLNVESSFAELMGAIAANDEGALIITKSRLIGEISHLRRLSGINLDSIL